MAWESLFFGSMPLKSAGPTFPPPAYPVDDLPRVENLLAVAKLNAVAAGAGYGVVLQLLQLQQ